MFYVLSYLSQDIGYIVGYIIILSEILIIKVHVLTERVIWLLQVIVYDSIREESSKVGFSFIRRSVPTGRPKAKRNHHVYRSVGPVEERY